MDTSQNEIFEWKATAVTSFEYKKIQNEYELHHIDMPQQCTKYQLHELRILHDKCKMVILVHLCDFEWKARSSNLSPNVENVVTTIIKSKFLSTKEDAASNAPIISLD